jgi:long-chain acyl-CoA synthetase
MDLGFIYDKIKNCPSRDAVVYNDKVYSYAYLNERIESWRNYIKDNIPSGKVVALQSDYSPDSISLLLVLIENNCIVVPISNPVLSQREKYLNIARAEYSISLNEFGKAEIKEFETNTDCSLYNGLRQKGHPGLVLFSSGSTGEVKGIVHDLQNLIQKYKRTGKDYRTLVFLLFDHIGGIDTLFYLLSNASCIITLKDRSPENVCRLIEKYQIEVLPVSPTFLNLLFLSYADKSYNLSSLKIITYGTEPMPEFILKKGNEIFPNVKFLQKFGTTEVGTLRSKSKNSDSLWVKLGDEDTQIRVVDGILQIKARSSMIGYLNAPSPFTEDGWFITGDQVEVDGEYYKILGRKTDIINVGGQKVYPAEVESVILEMDNVKNVTVSARENSTMGQVVCAEIVLDEDEPVSVIKKKVRSYCKNKLESYKVPVHVEVVNEVRYTERFKRIRK